MLDTLAPTAPLLRARLGDPRVVIDMLSRNGALLDGHFELLGGQHSNHFLKFSRIASDTRDLDAIGDWLTPTVAAWRPDAVLAPSTAGVALAWTLARNLGVPLQLSSVDENGRPSELLDASTAGKSLLLVNDVVTTGTGMAALAACAAGAGATVAGAAWFASRAEVDVAALIAAPAVCIAQLDLCNWLQQECPLCRDGEPVEPAQDLN